MSRPLLAVLALAALAASPALAAGPDFEALRIEPYEPPKPAPGFSLPDLDGRMRSLADVRGKVVLLVFWATW
jgi:hypothetical protein